MSEFDQRQLEAQVKELSESMDKLGETINGHAKAISVKLDRASDGTAGALTEASNKIVQAANTSAAASELHARSPVRATWALVGVTVVLVIVTLVTPLIVGH